MEYFIVINKGTCKRGASQIPQQYSSYLLDTLHHKDECFKLAHGVKADIAQLFELSLANFKNSTRPNEQFDAYQKIKQAASLECDAADYWLENNYIELSRCYVDGWTVVKNKDKAITYFNIAIKEVTKDNCIELLDYAKEHCDVFHFDKYLFAKRCIELGILCFPLEIVELLKKNDNYNSDKRAFKLLKKIAFQGSEEALIKLAECFEEGIGVDKNQAEAQRIYKIIADKGNIKYAYSVGLRLEAKIWKPLNKNDIPLVWFQKAADGGHVDAAVKVFEIINANLIQHLNDTNIISKYYKLAADLDVIEAQYEYGLIQKETEPKSAIFYFEKAAQKGHLNSAYELATLYEDILDYRLALDWYSFAAKNGHTEAQFRSGEFLYYGKAYKEDKKGAEHWYKLAAEKNHIEALYALGYCYAFHNDEYHIVQKSIPLFLKAAKLGHKEATFELGRCYLDKIGTAQNLSESHKWLSKSLNQNHQKAQKLLNKVNKSLLNFYVRTMQINHEDKN